MIRFKSESDSTGRSYFTTNAHPGDDDNVHYFGGTVVLTTYDISIKENKHHSVSFFIDDFDAFLEKVKKAKEEDDNSEAVKNAVQKWYRRCQEP